MSAKKTFKSVDDDLNKRVRETLGADAEAFDRNSGHSFADLFENAPIGIFRSSSGGEILSINPELARIMGYDSPKQAFDHYRDLKNHFYADVSARDAFIRQLSDKGQVENFEFQARRLDGHTIWLSTNARISGEKPDGNFLIEGFITDITRARRAEEAREHAEEQLRQALKMEAVGRLAGGVAHDFNNMLNVILGYSEISMLRLSPEDPVYKNLGEIQTAAERSAELTHQLLAFSRKQIIEPQVIDLNDTIAAQEKMLTPLVGEEIRIDFRPAPDLWHVCVDPSQIDQILTNLAVNARDAIAQTGTVTVETANVTLDETIDGGLEPFEPGDYVRLRFSDTGAGMDADTLSRIFEPFFTTKQRGEGTGLGLAMVYGIIKQNHGLIHAESTPGEGTTFDIYFPRHGDVGPLLDPAPEGEAAQGSETVLVVEDEAVVLDLAEMILEHYGYRVLKAGLPSKAIEIVRQYKGDIALLLTDVIMPEMNGRQLKEAIEKIRPEIKAIYMSGYTDDVIARRGIINADADLIEKPFSAMELTDKIRSVLDD